MKISDFEQELQAIDKNLSIRPNNVSERVLKLLPDANNMASVLYCGEVLCTIPNYDIYDEKNGNYGVDLRNDGRFTPHRTRPEALAIVRDKLSQLQNKEYADQFFGRGEYSDEALRRPEPEVPMLIEEVTAEAKVVTDGMIEGKVEEAK